MKILLITLLCSVFCSAQNSLLNDNFGSATQNPMVRTGWVTNAASGTAWELRTTSPSSGYSWTNPAVSASGNANVFTNLGNNSNVKTLTYDSMSTMGFGSIVVRFGGVKTSTVPAIDVSYSTDGTTYNSAGIVTLTTSWTAYAVALPAAAEGVPNLRVRLSVTANNNTGNFFRIDDFHVIGTCVLLPTDPAGTISALSNPSCGATSLSYSNAGATYYWQTTAGGTSLAYPTTSSYTLNATGTIYVRNYDGTSCWSTNTINSGTVTINTAASISAHPGNATPTDGGNTSFSVTAAGSGLAYQWQVDTGSGFGNVPAAAPYTNTTTATLNITGVTTSMTGYLYRCVVTPSGPCASINSNSASLTVTNTSPNNATAVAACYANNSISLSWTASAGTPVPDGYIVFAIQSATAPNAATPNDAGTYTANTDFSLASSVLPAALGKCVYKGTGTSTTITGLTNGVNYSFTVVAYRGTTQTGWATGKNLSGTWRLTNTTVDMPEVTALTASVADSQSVLSWTHVASVATCGYEYLIVANQGAVSFTPSGNGSAYTANSVYAGANQVIYKGTGNTMTVTGLTNGLNYCYKVFVRRGTEWSDGVSACAVPSLVYCSSVGTTSFQTSITNVTFNTINNTTAKPAAYNNYTAISTNATAGLSYPLSVSINTDGNYEDDVYAWIDFNHNGVFTDSGESFSLGSATNVASGQPLLSPLSITIPSTATVGSTRMRITVSYDLGINSCSSAFDGEVEDYTINILSGCSYVNVTSITPNSAPIGTEITINAASGLTGATATIGGLAMTPVSSSATQLVVKIPSGATTGNIVVTNAASCAGLNIPYTIIKEDKTSCEGPGGTFGDLIISEIYDTNSGNGLYVELYNPTSAAITVNAANPVYKLQIDNDKLGVLNGVNRTINITGTIPAGGTIIYNLGSNTPTESPCTGVSTVNFFGPGTNANDAVYLTKNGVVLDMAMTPNDTGYSVGRIVTAVGPTPTYNAADWTISLTESCTDLGSFPANPKIPPIVTVPTYNANCKTATVGVTATEGYIGGNTLTYQWMVAAPNATTWTVLTDTGIYSGTTTATLSVSNIATVLNYQYYCQIRENSGTCFTASNATKIGDAGVAKWNGTDWRDSNNAVTTPSLAKLVILDAAYNTTTSGSFDACSLVVSAGVTATIGANTYINIQNDLTVTGNLIVQSSGSLVQISDTGSNTGNISMYRDASIKKLDYVYWSSPVKNFPVNNVITSMPTNFIYKWEPVLANPNGGEGFWKAAAGDIMSAGRGYIARGPTSLNPDTATTATALFSGGEPNNGVIPQTIYRGNMTAATLPTYTSANGIPFTVNDDDNNLLGNPYPSAISAADFLTYNTTAPNDVIEGSVRLWRHGLSPAAIVNPFYNSYQYNYDINDYITYNGTASIPAGFNGYITAGQGFFVLMHEGNFGNATVKFNNAMRVKGNAPSNNSQFYKSGNTQTGHGIDRHRIWLDMVGPTGRVERTVIGYVPDATLEKDNMYDAYILGKTKEDFYSLINDERMIIQGRPVPFEANDRVRLGVKAPVQGTYTIAIAEVDGLFSEADKPIYIEDTAMNIIHDLRQAPYNFTIAAGTFDDRFVLRYTNENLSTQDFVAADSKVIVASDQQAIKIKSYAGNMKNIMLYDVLGRTVYTSKTVDSTEFEITGLTLSHQTLIVKILLESGQTVSRKIIF
jgi:hypothetical protein